MDSRERIKITTSNKQPDKLPVDFGSSSTTGMHVSIVYKLRQYYALDKPGTPVKVIEPYQMLGIVEDDLKNIIGVDVAGLETNVTFFGFSKDKWKEWKLDDGTPVLVPVLFNTEKNEEGGIYQYPEGDRNYPPSGKMPAKGFFFDSIVRQKTINEENLNPEENVEEFSILTDEELNYLQRTALNLRKNKNYAIIASVVNTSFGEIGSITGPQLREPKGIRDIEEWYISLFNRKSYIKEVFSRQAEISLKSYRKLKKTMADMIDIVFVTGTDFGMQQGLLISLDTYRELFKPFHWKINNWIHNNTSWKTFIHTDGSIFELIPDFIEAEFDIINPVQISAKGMDPYKLKKEYGKYITFWGGGVDTQKTLPFGTTKDVEANIRKMIEIFYPGGGFVFNTIHNIQPNVPLKNIITMFDIINDYR